MPFQKLEAKNIFEPKYLSLECVFLVAENIFRRGCQGLFVAGLSGG